MSEVHEPHGVDENWGLVYIYIRSMEEIGIRQHETPGLNLPQSGDTSKRLSKRLGSSSKAPRRG